MDETIESTTMISDSYTPDASANMGVSEDTDVSETADVLDSADSEEYTDEETTTPSPKEGVVYILGKRRTGSIEKKVEGYFNDIAKRQYSVTWPVNASESYQSNGNENVYVEQKSGKFFDLLPKGAVYKNDSIVAFADGKRLSEGQYSVNTVLNYKDSGRTMLIVNYDASADENYSFSYTTLHPWDALIDYGGDGEDKENVFEKWIDNGDGTWTYRFKVYDEDAVYYLWEEAMANYNCDHSADNPLEVTYEQGTGLTEDAVITNTKEARTSLTVSKTLAGYISETDKNTEFRFSISLSEPLSGYYGDIKFKDGDTEIGLKDGQSMTATDLPGGIDYTVTEIDANQNGYTTTSTGDSGTLEIGKVSTTAFTNTKDTPLPKTGNLKITKTVNAVDGVELNELDLQKDFMFTVTLYDDEQKQNINTDINGLYGDVIFESGKATMYLKHGESKKINDLPAGSLYKVVEGNGNADCYYGYICDNSNHEGNIVENTEITEDFINTKQLDATNGFTLTKKVIGVQTTKPFTFYVSFSGLDYGSVYRYSDGEFTSDNNGNANVSVYLSADESVRFDGLPIGSAYSVIETESNYIPSYKVTNSASIGQIASSERSNTKVNSALNTATETVDKDEDITVTFTYTSPYFDVTFAKNDSSGLYISGAELQVLDKEGIVIADWESEGEEYTISLPAGEYILHEEKAPDGYYLAEDIPFTISETGVLTVGEQPGEKVESIKMIDNPKVININIPGSGSKEELMFILFGCLLFTAGCIYIGRYYIKRRRRLQ